jgi:ribonuclease BN (tRNA processing enzyme)
MEIKFLGTGSAFCLKNYQSNMLISNKDKNFLIDCGGDARFSLNEFGYSASDIDAVYISHLHNDHIGGLEWLAFSTYFNPKCERPKLFIEHGIINDLWRAIGPGLESIQGQVATLDTYFEVIPVRVNKSFTFADICYDAVQSIHVSSGYKVVDSFGLMFNELGVDEYTRYYITTDCQFAPQSSMMAYYQEADVIFHDCETSEYKSGVHSNYDDLKNLNDEIKSKMYLYHYQDNVVENWDEYKKIASDDGFLGFIKKGAIFETRYKMQLNN